MNFFGNHRCDECGGIQFREVWRDAKRAFRLWWKGEPRIDIPPTMSASALRAAMARMPTFSAMQIAQFKPLPKAVAGQVMTWRRVPLPSGGEV